MKVTLKHVKNPDLMNGHGCNGYWEPMRRDKAMVAECATYADCAKACRDYIAKNGLGGGNWAGGDITDVNGNIIGYVSYNGRVWQSREYPQTEIVTAN